MFKKNYLSVYITDEKIVASEIYKGIFVNEPIASIIKSINIKWDLNKKIYEQNDVIISLLNYCVSRLEIKLLDSVTLLFIIPVEFIELLHKNKGIDNILGKVNCVRSIVELENIISAGAFLLKRTNTDLLRKFLIYSENNKTYISLLWAGGLVDFVCIEKNLSDVTKDDLLNGINTISMKLTSNIPDKFAKNSAINKFGYSWNEPIENNVYIIAPERTQYFWGQSIAEYKLIYIDYVENIVLQGANEIINCIRRNK